jgi:hypothetical protein
MNQTENIKAGLIHDWMYSNLSDFRKDAADSFLRENIEKNNPVWRGKLVYL